VFNVSVAEIDCIDLNRGDAVGTCACRIDAGLYWLVCRNDSTVADADFAHVSIRHLDVSAEAFAKAAQCIAETFNTHQLECHAIGAGNVVTAFRPPQAP